MDKQPQRLAKNKTDRMPNNASCKRLDTLQYEPQKFLGHSKLETTQLYAESSTEMMRESSQRALSR